MTAGADARTLAAYDRDAALFARDWESQPPPTDLHVTVRRFFRPGATADIGCGSGRDTAWLAAHGYAAIGIDASEGLLAEARRRHPGLSFMRADLPALAGLEGPFVNILCETVIMHLEPARVPEAVTRMRALLAPGGTLYLSWRIGNAHSLRDRQDRLYAAFDPGLVREALGPAAILLDEEAGSVSSGKLIRRLVARR